MIKKILLSLIFSLLVLPSFCLAADVRGGALLEQAITNTSYSTDKISLDQTGQDDIVSRILVGTIIRYVRIVLSIVGVLLLVLILYAGVLWLSAGGNSDKVDQAKKLITNAAIGAVIVGSSYIIAGFIESLTRVGNFGN